MDTPKLDQSVVLCPLRLPILPEPESKTKSFAGTCRDENTTKILGLCLSCFARDRDTSFNDSIIIKNHFLQPRLILNLCSPLYLDSMALSRPSHSSDRLALVLRGLQLILALMLTAVYAVCFEGSYGT